MIQLDEYFRPTWETNVLGYGSHAPYYIPDEYLAKKFFIVFRTCQSFGDWAIISAIPRLLKKKYPDATVAVPSPELIKRMYPTGIWSNKHEDYTANVAQVFEHNPYVDGMIDEIPSGMPVYHDHFRIYDSRYPNTPLTEQMLRYWQFEESERMDSAPELYWSDMEKKEGYTAVAKLFQGKPFGFLYIDDSFFEIHDPLRETLDYKRKRIQEKIDEFDKDGLEWLYYAGKDISETCYRTKGRAVDVRTVQVSKRVQNYMKSLSALIIGHQGGYGTDCMSRYPLWGCHVVPLAARYINEHFIRTTKYILP